MSVPVVHILIGENPPPRLDKALAMFVPAKAALSRTQISRLIAQGAVVRQGEVVTNPKTRTATGEEWEIMPPKVAEAHLLPEDIPLDVVYEDNYLIVVNKPAGMVVHPAPGSPSGTLLNALVFHCEDSLSGIGGEKRPGIVHRIDKDTSGLIVAAKSDRAHQGLATQFADHSITRKYCAVVYGVPSRVDPRLAGVKGVAFEPGNVIRISGNIARHRTDRKKMAVVAGRGRHAITRFCVHEDFAGRAALLHCWLETGRTHQIRVHLTHVGHGLIGDQTYGGKRRIAEKTLTEQALEVVRGFPRQALHAAVLGFVHPVSGDNHLFEAEMPADMQDLVAALRFGVS